MPEPLLFEGNCWKFGHNIPTDEITPTSVVWKSFSEMAKHVFESLNPEFSQKVQKGDIIVAGRNFGCGSSREHAPIALAAAGIEAVVAEFYARIFFRNAVNGGYLVPFECAERLCDKVCTGDELRIVVADSVLHNLTTGERWQLKPLGEVAPIVEAGGVFQYARKVGMLES